MTRQGSELDAEEAHERDSHQGTQDECDADASQGSGDVGVGGDPLTYRGDCGDGQQPSDAPAGSGAGPGYDGRPEQGAGQDSGTSPGPVIRESSFPLKGVGQRTAPDRMQVRRVRSENDKGFFPKRFPQSLSAAVRQMLGAQPTGTNSRPERHSSRLPPHPRRPIP